jgi:DNA-binding NarL/FixJ family response regulator
VSMINVFLVGTNNLFLQGLRSLLDPSQFSVAGEARDLATLEARLEGGVAPDLVVADLNGSHESDLDRLRAIRAKLREYPDHRPDERALSRAHDAFVEGRNRRLSA